MSIQNNNEMNVRNTNRELMHGSAVYQYWGIRRARNEHPNGMYIR